ncbi:MAG: PHP domain-containing protein [Clostridia bacterium]|nr:PHP domain-containing protein [Clostridia bacterium]
MSRKYLIPETGNWYKANLHCHTTVSDGNCTPEEIKKIYKERGYSIVAYSDHEKLVPHPELIDKDFLAITAFEPSIPHKTPWWAQTYHLNFFSKKLDRDYFFEYDKIHSVENLNKIIAKANAEGFLVQYNHPRWSQQESPDYTGLKGLWSFEVFNTSCEIGYLNGYGDEEYTQLIRRTQSVVPTADDDNHNKYPLDDPLSDSFGGWTMIKAENLEYDTVISAMERGDLYASTGPIIKSLYIEDGKVHIETENCNAITLRAQNRLRKTIRSHNDDLTEGVFDILDEYEFIRIVLSDTHNNRAFTRVYTKSEF